MYVEGRMDGRVVGQQLRVSPTNGSCLSVSCHQRKSITPTPVPTLQLFCGFEPTNSPLGFLAYKRMLMTPSLGAAGVVGVEKINCAVVSSTVSRR